MSASPIARQVTQSQGQAIPKRILINDASQIPNEYSTTPGGTMYSTTPGGTRIIYDRATLMNLRNSPVARTPPKNLPVIPGVTCDAQKGRGHQHQAKVLNTPPKPIVAEEKKPGDEPQFEMDM